ncbi:hypothetical protein MVEN_01436800 [Mycena venus]|uniref:Restriction of telomere capping protein 4 n=1 Tax=Mycena venus TaxID=2733690 RepID=A0A8H6XZN6_9AGAR|nr:hypothetical protein MVEN_01436800 [Mycena venus]
METISAPAQARDIIEIPDSPPLSASSLPPPQPSSSAPPSRPTPVGKQYPDSFYVIEHQEAWDYYQSVKDSGAKTSIQKLWPTLFPGSTYIHTTVTKWKRHQLNPGLHFELGARPMLETVDVPSIPNPPPSPPPAPQPIPLPQPVLPITAEFGLCLFCDTPFTVAPSAKLAALHQKLLAASTSAPTAANPDHRTAALTSQSSAFCRQHTTDSKLLPSGRQNHWPEHINYAGISERMDKASVMDTLQELLENLEACESFAASKSGNFKSATAYFGEIGYSVIALKVKSLFPAATITVDYSPLAYNAPAEQVLIPEAIICLIMDELGHIIRMSRIVTVVSRTFATVMRMQFRKLPHFHFHLRCFPRMLYHPPLRQLTLSASLHPPSLIPDNLCHFCDEELPFAPSNALIAMGKKLFDLSWPDRMPDNPQHRRVPQIQMTVDYCARHRFEKDHIPAAIFGGWPFKPNFSRLFHRILDLGPTLRHLCKSLNQSHFFLNAIEYYSDELTQRSSLKAQYASNRSSEHGAGYYGERGYQLLDITIRFMFPDTELLLKTFHPLTYDIAIREILIPETVTRLIQQDLDLGSEDAVAVLKQSYTFGITLQPSDDDCEFYMAAMHSISRSHRRTEWSLRVWEAEGTASGLDFESWLRKQMDLEHGVKAEAVEHGILAAPDYVAVPCFTSSLSPPCPLPSDTPAGFWHSDITKYSKCFRTKRQYHANICLNINVKLAGINTIPDPSSVSVFTDQHNPTIVMGADVIHPEPGSDSHRAFTALIANVDYNTDTAKYLATSPVQTSCQERIEELGAMTTTAYQ